MTPEHYRQLLLAPIRGAATAGLAEPPALPLRAWFPPEDTTPPAHYSDLFVNGVLCGHRESRDFLATRLGSLDRYVDGILAENEKAIRELAQSHEEIADQQLLREMQHREHEEHIREFEDALAAARRYAVEIEESTFWRMTAPVRYVVHRGKLAWTWTRGLAHRARLLGPRFATARQIVKDQGVAELARRMHRKLRQSPHPVTDLRPRGRLEMAIEPLHIPSSETPRVSVVIPTYGQDLHTFTCLRALAREAARVPLEVLVMDDCAPVPAAEALSGVTGVRFERNAENLGFLRNSNRGARLARGEFLLFLNNDAVLSPGAIASLLRVFETDARTGAVGAKLVFPNGRLQEAGGIVWRDGSAWNYGRGDDPGAPQYNYLREADYCSAACLLVPRQLFLDLGSFDERYLPAYCEDTDFCFKVRKAGRKVYYQPAAEVVHFEGVSHGTDVAGGVKRHQVENQARLRERWNDTLRRHRVNGHLPRLERDRAATKRVLFVEACMLTPDQDSGSVRTWRMLEILRGLGAKVTFVAENLQYLDPYVPRLQQAGVEVLYAPHVRSVETFIEAHGAEFDVIVLARYYVASRYIARVRKYAPRALLVLDTLDLHYLRNRRLAELEGSRALAQSAEAIYRQEIDCIRSCDVTWVVSHVEQEILAREVPRADVQILSNIHDVHGRGRGFAEREGLLFVGGYRHPPNVDAALHFAKEIAPRLRERLPGVKSYLIGSNAPKAVLDLAGDGIEVVGFVPDLAPWFERCRLSISPLRYGAGVKGKINHSMSYGLPVVATTPSVEGMHLLEGEEIVVADGPDAFADAVVRVYTDEALWERLSLGGIANVRRHFSAEVAEGALRYVLDAAARKARASRDSGH